MLHVGICSTRASISVRVHSITAKLKVYHTYLSVAAPSSRVHRFCTLNFQFKFHSEFYPTPQFLIKAKQIDSKGQRIVLESN